MRVLLTSHVFPRSETDAAAPFMLRYARALRDAGLDVRVIAPHDPGLPEEHRVAGIPVRRVGYAAEPDEDLAYRGEMHVRARSAGGAVKALRLVAALRRAVRAETHRWGPDVIDVHWLIPSGLAIWHARVGVPNEVVVHGTDLALAGEGRLRRLVARRIAAVPDLLAAASPSLAGDCARVLGRSVDEIVTMPPRPVPGPPPYEVPAPPDEGRILAVGRLVKEKGHMDLIEAAGRLGRYDYDVQLVIVGDGPERDRLAEAARRRKVALRLPGAVSPEELESHYAAADIVAVPSHREGFGLVAVEALARRRPVVASRAGGLADIVTAETGWSVPPRDVFALASTLASVLDAPHEAERRAAAGARAVAGRWSAEAVGQAAVERFSRLTSSRA